jgi:class 3 adenylate cyclase
VNKSTRKAILELLTQSLTSDRIGELGQEVDSEFRLNELSGFGEQIRIPGQVAAQCVLDYFEADKELLRFVAHLFLSEARTADRLKGRERVLELLAREDWIFDADLRQFVKDQNANVTDDWGYMLEGREYRLCFASVDVVDSSALTDATRAPEVEQTLNRFRNYVRKYTELWNGRLWNWRGDGGTAVFQGADSVNQAAVAMVGVLLNLPVFNIQQSRLETELRIRIGMHCGTAQYQSDVQHIFSHDMRTAARIEKESCEENGIALSASAHAFLKNEVQTFFTAGAALDSMRIFQYRR